MKSAVLVIDVQQGLCEGEGAAFDCAATIHRINEVTRKARLAAAPVIFVQHESESGYLEHGTSAWQLANGLDVQPSDLKVRKKTPDAFLRTNLEELLREDGVQRLVVCGMHSEFCIDTTTRRALALGFPVVLVSDGHTSAGNAAISPQQVIAHENATLTNISSFGPRAIAVPSAEVEFAA
ncbi:cysteine hydrolase family protein [Acidihalobacter prosperus]|uniref:cysteine hydrolase family protein n=1 Tax=Acidihalobacter prosperus TaxID=160660 RepID=UPI000508D9BC|nr:cysteine hydrolase family protein [Acidihalobacter prosperus]